MGWPLSEIKAMSKRERRYWIMVTKQRIEQESGEVVEITGL